MAANSFECPALPRRLGWPTVVALFLASVGLILGAVPGWTMCFLAWLVLSWLILAAVLLHTVFVALAAVLAGRPWATWRGAVRQFAVVIVLMFAMSHMDRLSTWVELAQVRAGLQARAAASARAGGPRVATTQGSSDSPSYDDGFVYDPDGVLVMPLERLPKAWRDDPVLVAVAGDCRGLYRFVGPYYRWYDGCG